MTLISTLFSGQSGLEGTSEDLSVIADNIANSDTIGFKSSRADFEDALAQSVLGAGQIGTGTQLQAVQKILSQGAITNTGVATDLALSGSGFFVVAGNHNGVDTNYYTRAGQFSIDKNGLLVNPDGLDVQGYSADSSGNVGSLIGNLNIGAQTTPPQATTTVTMKANLDSNATIPAAPWDPTNAAATSNFSTGVTVYDNLGNAIPAQVYFVKTAAGYDYHVTTDGSHLAAPAVAGTNTEIAGGSLSFDPLGSGKLNQVTVNAADTFQPVGQANPQTINFNFGDPLTSNGVTPIVGNTGLSGVTQFSGNPSAVSFVNQDGYASGSLASIAIDQNGLITGSFTNGSNRDLGQVAVATFQSPDKLERSGGNLFAQDAESGDPAVGVAGSSGRGSITSGALEQSNVDLSNEFIHMIAAQRNFQADGKSITTADSLLSELMNIKR